MKLSYSKVLSRFVRNKEHTSIVGIVTKKTFLKPSLIQKTSIVTLQKSKEFPS